MILMRAPRYFATPQGNTTNLIDTSISFYNENIACNQESSI